MGEDIEIIIQESDDNRSYHINSEKVQKHLNFSTKHSVLQAVSDLKMHLTKNYF